MRPQLGDVGQAVPPNAKEIARSGTILPGSCRANGPCQGASAALSARSRPTVVAGRVSSAPPVPDTTLRPVPSTARRGYCPLRFFT
jgi:hypothetical protein